MTNAPHVHHRGLYEEHERDQRRCDHMTILDEDAFPFTPEEVVAALALIASQAEAEDEWKQIELQSAIALESAHADSDADKATSHFRPSLHPSDELLALLWHLGGDVRVRVERLLDLSLATRRTQIMDEARKSRLGTGSASWWSRLRAGVTEIQQIREMHRRARELARDEIAHFQESLKSR